MNVTTNKSDNSKRSHVIAVFLTCLFALACFAISGCGSAPSSKLSDRGTPAAKYKEAAKAAGEAGVMLSCDGEGEVTFLDFHAHPDVAAAVHHVKEFPNLKMLNFSSSKLDDAGLANVADLVHVEELGLHGTNVTNAGLAHLAKLSKLRQLNLTDTSVSNEGLQSLGALKELVRIDLQNTKVDDDGLQHLEQLPNLMYIQLSNCDVTDEAIEALRQKFPDAQIVHGVIEDTSNVPMLTDAELPDA